MKRIIFFVLLTLLLQMPFTSLTTAYGQNTGKQKFSEIAAPEKSERFPEHEDDIFSSTYERELLTQKIFNKSLPPLSRKEKIIWSFKTAKAVTFL